ncbi:MAG: hypothetical protein ABR920_12525 [Terriglobales bacterium]
MKKFLAVVVFCLPAFGQVAYSGSTLYQGTAVYGTAGAPFGFAELPQKWVDPTICNPPGGVFDTTIILGTTLNGGPNNAGEAIGAAYAVTPLGLRDAMDNWRDNADGLSQTPHFADKWWLIEVPDQRTAVLESSTYDHTNFALISLPGKLNPIDNSEPTKCLVVDSQSVVAVPSLLPAGQMVCGHGLPGFGGTRDPGCASSNDKQYMWKLQLDGSPYMSSSGDAGIWAGQDIANPLGITGSCRGSENPAWASPTVCVPYANHILIKHVEIALQPGVAQSGAGHTAGRLFGAVGGGGYYPPRFWPTNIGLVGSYMHGNDPGDPGQPSGACSAWTNEGYVIVAPDSGNPGTSLVTWQAQYSSSINTYFGMTFTVGSAITIGGTGYTIANTSYTLGVLTGIQNTQLSITGNLTINSNTLYTQSNPPLQYANGCGDDVFDAVTWHVNNGWLEDNYIEKIHWWGSESHAVLWGNGTGPVKMDNNWVEGGSVSMFSGGSAADSNGGPSSDNEIRRDYIGKDINYRMLTGSPGHAPHPPFGCGPSDLITAHNTCPFLWVIKNDFELKVGHRTIIDGNLIENSWQDGQGGYCILINIDTCSGGQVCGIYDQSTGLPTTSTDNVRFSNNWVRNCPGPIELRNRSGGQFRSGGDGGGVSLPGNNDDYINNLFSNVADAKQFGDPGESTNGTEDIYWVAGQNSYVCNMAGSTPSVGYATAACLPEQSDVSVHITKVVSTQTTGPSPTLDPLSLCLTGTCNYVTITDSNRLDPYLCQLSTAAACVTAGRSVTLTGTGLCSGSGCSSSPTAPGAGTFAMVSTTLPNTWTAGSYTAKGTGGQGFTYLDTANTYPSGTTTLCTGCQVGLFNSGTTGDLTFASLGFKMTDISPGDGVYAYNNGADTSCTTQGYAVGASPPAVYASAGTTPTGLTVVYPNSGSGAATCLISNRAGTPHNVTVQNNTFLAVNNMAIYNADQTYQPISNYFWNNVFADNDTKGNGHIDFYSAVSGGEGAGAFPFWDTNTLRYYQNVMAGRPSANYSVLNCPGGTCANDFPPNGAGGTIGGSGGGVNCPTSSPTANCMGYAGFMGSSPTVTYPSGACVYDGSDPTDCPLMALPWSTNFSLADLAYVGGSSYAGFGVDTSQLSTAMTANIYTCGTYCGTHGPYADY